MSSSGSYDPYGSSSGQPNPYGDSGANPNPYGGTEPYAGGTPTPYSDQGPYTSPAPAAPPSGSGYADPYAGRAPGYQPPGSYGQPGSHGQPGSYAPPGSYGGGYYPPVVGYQNAAGGWSLGLGIAAIVLCFVPVLTQGIAIGAIITGVIGRNAASEGRANNGGMALAGIILGAACLLLSIVGFIWWLNTFSLA